MLAIQPSAAPAAQKLTEAKSDGEMALASPTDVNAASPDGASEEFAAQLDQMTASIEEAGELLEPNEPSETDLANLAQPPSVPPEAEPEHGLDVNGNLSVVPAAELATNPDTASKATLGPVANSTSNIAVGETNEQPAAGSPDEAVAGTEAQRSSDGTWLGQAELANAVPSTATQNKPAEAGSAETTDPAVDLTDKQQPELSSSGRETTSSESQSEAKTLSADRPLLNPQSEAPGHGTATHPLQAQVAVHAAAANVTSTQPLATTGKIATAPATHQVTDHVLAARQSIRNGNAQLEVMLDPPELGKITIELTEVNDKVSARLVVAESATLETLRSSTSNMLESLAEAGVALDGFQLESSDSRSAQHDRDELAAKVSTDATSSDPSQETVQRVVSARAVDIMV